MFTVTFYTINSVNLLKCIDRNVKILKGAYKIKNSIKIFTIL